ncbi:MAG: GNAT family N-acetyltransferase [Lachnospiraceae bacterium]|nr:GNAT family N-acetyltransferase [Lachnospiraceae bacterium]
MQGTFKRNDYIPPEGDDIYTFLDKIEEESDSIKQLAKAYSANPENPKTAVFLANLSEFADVVKRIYEIERAELAGEGGQTASAGEKRSLAEKYAILINVLRNPMRQNPMSAKNTGTEPDAEMEDNPSQTKAGEDAEVSDALGNNPADGNKENVSDSAANVSEKPNVYLKPRVFRLEGEELLSYAGFLPASIMQDDNDFGGMDYYGYEENGEKAGIMVTIPDYSTILLRYIWIAEEYRDCGRGKRALMELLNLLAENTSALTVDIVPALQPKSYLMFKACGFKERANGGGCFRFNLSQLNVEEKYIRFKTSQAKPLSDASRRRIAKLWEEIENAGQDFVPSPIDNPIYDPALSCIYVEGEEYKAILLVQAENKSSIHVSYLFSRAVDHTALLQLFAYFYRGLKESTLTKALISFDTLDEKLTAILKKIMGISCEHQETLRLPTSRFLEDMSFAYQCMQDYDAAFALETGEEE